MGGNRRPSSFDDHELARYLAQTAGQRLLSLRASWDQEPALLRSAGDRAAHLYLASELAALRPGDAVLSEEGADSALRLAADRVWIVDPLDGTREFGEVPRTDWAVHVALWARGELVAGAVSRPAMGDTLATDQPPLRPVGRAPRLRLAVSRTRPPQFVTALATRLGADLVPMGSAGIKVASVIDNVTDAYVHAGGQFEWDSAAPVAVARSAGLHTSRIDGSPLVYNRADPTLPDLLVCRPEVAADLLAVIADESTTYEGAVS